LLVSVFLKFFKWNYDESIVTVADLRHELVDSIHQLTFVVKKLDKLLGLLEPKRILAHSFPDYLVVCVQKTVLVVFHENVQSSFKLLLISGLLRECVLTNYFFWRRL